MKKMFLAPILVVGGLMTISAQANDTSFVSGDKLLAEMLGNNPASFGFVLGYVAGVHDTASANRWICTPDSYTQGKAAQEVRKFLERSNNLQLRSEEASAQIIGLLMAKYPCR